MEAAVAEREEAGMTEWNDGRLDELGKRIDEGFAGVDRKFEKVDERFKEVEQKFEKVDQRFKEVERKMDAGFARIDNKFDELHRMLFKAAWTLAIGLLGLMGVMVAQL